MNMELLTKLKYKKAAAGTIDPGGIETHCLSMRGWL